MIDHLKRFAVHIACLAILFITSACSTVPFTNRAQLNLIPESQVMSMSLKQYSEVKEKSKVVKTGVEAARIQRVGKHMAKVIDEWLTEEEIDREFEWEFILIDDKQVNAWCMPGGKVAFYTGIMKYCNSDQAVAVVMGHEIAHAICRHGNERMSAALLSSLGGIALAVALNDQPSTTRTLW